MKSLPSVPGEVASFIYLLIQTKSHVRDRWSFANQTTESLCEIIWTAVAVDITSHLKKRPKLCFLGTIPCKLYSLLTETNVIQVFIKKNTKQNTNRFGRFGRSANSKVSQCCQPAQQFHRFDNSRCPFLLSNLLFFSTINSVSPKYAIVL